MDESSPQAQKRWSSALWAVREVDQLFSRFGRYTRFVVYSKWSLVAVALVLIISLIAWPLMSRDRSGLRISFVDKKTSATAPSSPVMTNPQYRGIGDKGQQYTINGASATQKTPTLVIIEKVESQMLRPDGSWYSLTADRAEYQQDAQIIELYGQVNVVDTQSNRFITEHATVETANMHIVGDKEVVGTGPRGNILASGFEITDNGEHILFTGGDQRVQVTVKQAKKR